jgi:UDP-glucose 4-epimerase
MADGKAETIAIVGGGGYIGSHVCRTLENLGLQVVIADNWSSGSRRRVAGRRAITVDIADPGSVKNLETAFHRYAVTGVIHLAGLKDVAASFDRPDAFKQTNTQGTAHLLEAMKRVDVTNLVFSSTAAVYSQNPTGYVVESDPCAPASPYGLSKWRAEKLISRACGNWGLNATALRYFNVAGTANVKLAEFHGTNVIPSMLERVLAGRPPIIFGNDHPTPDGTCVRDYIHVSDLAAAHGAVLTRLPPGFTIFNVGTGHGTSVRELAETVCQVTGSSEPAQYRAQRQGDVPMMVADATALRAALGWRATHDVREMVQSQWAAMRGSAAGTHRSRRAP